MVLFYSQDGSQNALRSPQEAPKTDSEPVFFALENRLRFGVVLGSILGPFCLPKGLPFGTLLAFKIDQKIDPKSDCLKGRSKIAPRAPKTLPRRPPDPLGQPQDHPRRFPGAQKCPRGSPQRPKSSKSCRFLYTFWEIIFWDVEKCLFSCRNL